MVGVTLSLQDGAQSVRIEMGDSAGPRRRELEHVLLLNGGSPSAGAFSIPVLAFRRCAVELARLLRKIDTSVELELPVEQLLRVQLEEIAARRSAERELRPLAPDEVEKLVTASGRFIWRLTDEQITNLGRLLALRHGANFSVPGAGKTATLLGVYEACRARGDVEQLLVVAPKNAFISWEDETKRWYRLENRPTIRRLQGGVLGVEGALDAHPEVALITYQLLPNVLERVKAWASLRPTHVTLDESHRIKAGQAGVTAAAALELAGVADRRDILSGTPLPHSAEDLRPQFDFLWPGQRILPDFRLPTEAEVQILEQVERTVRSLYVRTTKDQLHLPRLHVQPVAVKLGPLQRELYDLLKSEAARVASGMRQRDRGFFRLLGRHVVRLLQAAVNPMLLTQGELVDRDELEPLPQGSRAWELLRELARYELPEKVLRAVARSETLISEGHKVLIWTQFVMNVRSLERLLAHHGAVVLYGEVPTGEEGDPDTREGRIKRFHEDPSCKVMIANPAAAGEGISLHMACHHAIYLDRSFNAAHYLQSVDRIHRLGTDVEAHVEILEASETIDSRVASRMKAKIDAMATILNDPGLAALSYDPADVQEEFGAGIEPADLDEILNHLEAPEED